MRYVYDDGGRAAAGFDRRTGDCVCRAIAIATGKPYREVYDGLNALCALYGGNQRRGRTYAESGVPQHITDLYLGGLQWRFVSTNKERMRRMDMPAGRLIVRVSKHLFALIDNVVHDNGEHWRGLRPVHGYYVEGVRS
jgi:hypothetical protein